MFRSGDIVYFKEAKNGTHRKAQGARFKGLGIGVFLGHVGPFEKQPTLEQAVLLIGACGYLSFDDVAEFAGDEVAATCVRKYEEKYYPKAKAEVKDPEGKPVLVRADGRTPLLAPVNKIKEAIENAKSKHPVTPEQEAEITAKVCGALGIDPSVLDACPPSGEAAGVKETGAPGVPVHPPANAKAEVNGAASEAPIFPKREPLPGTT